MSILKIEFLFVIIFYENFYNILRKSLKKCPLNYLFNFLWILSAYMIEIYAPFPYKHINDVYYSQEVLKNYP